MTAPRECRPPEGTPDGTVCVLGRRNEDWRFEWDGRFWIDGRGMEHLPESLASEGFRFHSIAEPPHD